MGSPARVKLNPSKLIHGHAVSYKIRSVACVQSTPIKSLSCSHPPRNTSTNLSQSKPRNTSTNISQSKTHVSAEGLGPKDGGRWRWETEGVKMSGGIASHPAAASGAASGGLDQHQDLINDLHGSPPEVWQGFSVRSLETYANKVTDLFTELQSTRGQPYPGKQPQTPAVCEQNPATRDAACIDELRMLKLDKQLRAAVIAEICSGVNPLISARASPKIFLSSSPSTMSLCLTAH